jgi:beta-phosphoglucomutase
MSRQFGLVFDVDGVIVDSEAVNVRATAKAFADILGIRGVQPKDFENGIGKGAEEYVKAGARSHGRDLNANEVQDIVKARQDNFLAILRDERIEAYPGVRELIANAIADSRFGVAIATSSTRQKSQSVLESAQIPYKEMVYVCADDIRDKKPNPEIFQVACRQLDLTPGRCVVVEDAPNGVQAALAAGCKCIAVMNTFSEKKLKMDKPDLIVDSLSEVSLDTIVGLLED